MDHEMTTYAVIDAQGAIVNRVIVDAESPWQAPEGLTSVEELSPMVIGGTYIDGAYTPPPEPEAPPAQIPAITKAQALLYLLSIGKTEADVLAAIATISDPTERTVAEIEWNYRQPFRHDHPLFAALGPAVGITDMEAAFRVAALL